ncbi:phosphate ABC transporter ATP-binding protein [Luteolibacter yonseiensis]|uniref:Phosphate ABC transporter ATP-binding protein n=1 Tax=Luteolibacter yonseiensis TaxID=1144680 RepID=A0A934V9N3_9BACT|nr:phosphate ABC transporter ATP-binding protein PstB [Luteolibacter yonseiensis]MBK1814340.1 phosphate ABC transporter ATP-binding protein [Luteolibacter yonseiensis]
MQNAIQIQNVSFAYHSKQVLHDVTLDIPEREITAFIGPSGCGKSTLLRCINRINDRISGAHIVGGSIHVRGIDINRPDIDLQELRRQVGMVFQKYNPFAKSIYENVAFSLRVAGRNKRSELDEIVENALRGSALWDEVKDRLHSSAFGLSGGQQQRLCIARAIANQPQILLMDEPCAALDPLATLKVEELLVELKKKFTIVIVTHNMAQAARCSDRTAFMYLGKLIEYGPSMQIFESPKDPQTEAYVTGTFG